jgi:hypothetical protein
MLICTVLILSVKDGLSAVRYRYNFEPYCPVIKEMFTDEATFHSYALMDMQYLPKAQTAGIY